MCFQSNVLTLGYSTGVGIICDTARKRSIKIRTQTPADDTQLYLSFDVFDEASECRNKVEKGVRKIRERMNNNMPKPNDVNGFASKGRYSKYTLLFVIIII